MTPTHNAQPIVVFSARQRQTKGFLGALEATGFNLIWIADPEEIAPRGDWGDTRQLAEPISGSYAVLLDRITRWQPALILMDMDHASLPWRDWMAMLKSVPASRRIPLIGFSDNCDEEIVAEGRRRGAELVLPWEELSRHTANIVRQYARTPNPAAIDAFCQRPLSAFARQGINLFNQGSYFEAHEALEEALKLEPEAEGALYRALLQVAVAYLHITRKNFRGALKMFIRLRQWLYPLPERCQGVDVAALRADVRRVYNHLLALGAERIDEFDLGLLRPVRVITE